jgi:hypothetical protein
MPLINEPLLPSTANILYASGIAKSLQSYPNQRFVDALTSITISGARVGFQRAPAGKTQRPNHSSAQLHPEVISKSNQEELRKGRVKENTSALPSASFQSSSKEYKPGGESSSMFPPHKDSLSTMGSQGNTVR